MKLSQRQGQLFPENLLSESNAAQTNEISLSRNLLENWQKKVHRFQSELFQHPAQSPKQASLFQTSNPYGLDDFDPLKLTPLPLSFWRWPSCPHSGPAIYLVMDRPELLKSQILLYIGETIAAERRWKGEHDCKAYLSAYTEALGNVGLKSQLSIRFWTDVPKATRSRRNVEQILIQRWLPPFNKETRERWMTPFTSET